MKLKLIMLFLFAVCTFASCSKDIMLNDSAASLTLGRWKTSETYISPGGPTEWQTVKDNDAKYLVFNEDKTISGDYASSVSYEVTDSKSLSLAGPGNTKRTYSYQVTATTLELSGGGCIEACITRFVRVK